MKDKRVIRQILTIYLVCFVARIFEYFVLRTDQTILGEAFIHKLFGIIVICLVVKRSGETLSDIGFVKNGYIRSAVKGLALGLSMFAIGYFVEILILMQNRTYAGIRFYVSAYAVDTNIAKQTSVLFILICIIGNFINVLMEEGLFRGLFPRMLNSRRFWKVTGICSLLFGFWHIVGPVRNYIDGQSSFQGMIANAIMLIVSSTLVGLKLAMITYMEGNLYMGMADHFVNNTIVNLLHIESSTGTDEMMFLRITVAQTISFLIVLFIFWKGIIMGRKGLLIKQFLNNAFVTTTIVLIVLSVVALWYDGTMICISTIFETLLLSAVCEVIKHMMYKIDIANIYLGILLHYLLVLVVVLIFGYAFNWVNQLPVYVLAGMCGVVLILCCYLDISRVKADIDEINGLCENRL